MKEANLAFALNTHLFSLIRSPPISSTAQRAIKPPQPELRYYERRELERQEEKRLDLLANPPPPPLTWREWIEKFLLFAAAAVFAVLVSQVVVPVAQQYLGQRSVREEL